MVMRMVSLGFDMDPVVSRNKEKIPARVPRIPSILEYSSYCLFPSTSVFGPFLVYEEHIKYLDASSPVSFTLFGHCSVEYIRTKGHQQSYEHIYSLSIILYVIFQRLF